MMVTILDSQKEWIAMTEYCGECKQECVVITVDYGIGSYEFWGARGCDTQLALVSNCCEADVFTDEACTIPYEPDYPDQPEPDYDDDITMPKEEQEMLEAEYERKKEMNE